MRFWREKINGPSLGLLWAFSGGAGIDVGNGGNVFVVDIFERCCQVDEDVEPEWLRIKAWRCVTFASLFGFYGVFV